MKSIALVLVLLLLSVILVESFHRALPRISSTRRFCIEEEEEGGSEESVFKGKHRRILRSIANRLKSNDEMSTLQYSGRIEKDDAFIDNLKSILIAHELVLIKANVKKKKEAKEMGLKLALSSGSELVQVVGHTILLYSSSGEDGKVTKMLGKELLIQAEPKPQQ